MKNITHYIKTYKGMEIWELSNGNYIVRYYVICRSDEFSSIKKCKDFINNLRGE